MVDALQEKFSCGVSSVVVLYLGRLAMPCLGRYEREGTPLYFHA